MKVFVDSIVSEWLVVSLPIPPKHLLLNGLPPSGSSRTSPGSSLRVLAPAHRAMSAFHIFLPDTFLNNFLIGVGTSLQLSATIKLKEEGKTGNQRDQCVEDDEAFSERFVWQDAHKADQAQEEEFHAEESGATPTGSSARGESGQLDGHGPPGTEPDQRERAIALAEALSSEYPQRPPPAPRLPPGQFRLAKNGSPAPGRGPAAIVARPAPVHRPTTGADPACV